MAPEPIPFPHVVSELRGSLDRWESEYPGTNLSQLRELDFDLFSQVLAGMALVHQGEESDEDDESDDSL